MANLATRAGVEGTARTRILAPLIAMTKADIIRTGRALGVDYTQTISCYDPAPDGTPCGRCDACALRRKGVRRGGRPRLSGAAVAPPLGGSRIRRRARPPGGMTRHPDRTR
jgi:7-cyano-7-deazaguanine synthase in queuosine biosynthesis